MPEHVHLVLCPVAEEYSMPLIASVIKSPSAKAVLRLHPRLREECRTVRKGRRDEFALWQPGGGYDRNLFTADEAWEKIQYAHANPLRRGLVQDALDYQWSSFGAYYERETPIPVDLCLWEG